MLRVYLWSQCMVLVSIFSGLIGPPEFPLTMGISCEHSKRVPCELSCDLFNIRLIVHKSLNVHVNAHENVHFRVHQNVHLNTHVKVHENIYTNVHMHT